MQNLDTIAALATPSGRSAIAVIRVSGVLVPQLVENVFKTRKLQPRTATVANYHSVNNLRLDNVVYTYYKGPASYTGEDSLEINCHGNPLIVNAILLDLTTRGCRMAEPGEFTKLAFINGKLDLTQAEAVRETIHATSERALQVAQKQLSGSIGEKIHRCLSQLISVIAHLEAYIDFPEEDLPDENSDGPIHTLSTLLLQLDEMIATSQYEALLKDGIRTVIMGEPNAGKSSLLNALLGKDRALVSDEPGTTRDYLEDQIHIGPYLFRIIDTAGIRQHTGTIERLGIQKTIQQLDLADLIIWVVDTTNPHPTLPHEILKKLSNKPTILVQNKCDIQSDLPVTPTLAVHGQSVQLSALTGKGVDVLRKALENMVKQELDGIGPDTIVISARHAAALKDAQHAIEQALFILKNGQPTELAATELRICMESIGRITGKIDNEQVLDELFSSFCIGK